MTLTEFLLAWFVVSSIIIGVYAVKYIKLLKLYEWTFAAYLKAYNQTPEGKAANEKLLQTIKTIQRERFKRKDPEYHGDVHQEKR